LIAVKTGGCKERLKPTGGNPKPPMFSRHRFNSQGELRLALKPEWYPQPLDQLQIR